VDQLAGGCRQLRDEHQGAKAMTRITIEVMGDNDVWALIALTKLTRMMQDDITERPLREAGYAYGDVPCNGMVEVKREEVTP